MFECPCPGCPKLYLTQVEADLCTPADQISDRFPARQKIDQKNSVFGNPDQING